MHPKILIILTTPFSVSDSSRSLDSYFHFWERENLRQIYTRNWIPSKGHCGELFQITDANLLRMWIHKTDNSGVIYRYDDLLSDDTNKVLQDNSLVSKTYRLGAKHTPTIELLRGLLWRKKYWCTQKLVNWLDQFQPDCIFYNFSNHIFTQQIALFAANRYNIPIITAIGDDYYFNDRASISLAYHLYRIIFKRLTRKIFAWKGSAAFSCDKMKEKYNDVFELHGESIYLSSTTPRREFSYINKKKPIIAYFGSIRLGRNNSLLDIANALRNIEKSYILEVYSNELDPVYYQQLKEHPNVFFGGAIPYSMVQERTSHCDIVVVAEGFHKKDINFTKYSLSTKAADALACGTAILAYGPSESGLIGYMLNTEAAMVCTDSNSLEECIRTLIIDQNLQRKNYERAIIVTHENHTLERSNEVFEGILCKCKLMK